jgi:hypothetical protein
MSLSQEGEQTCVVGEQGGEQQEVRFELGGMAVVEGR